MQLDGTDCAPCRARMSCEEKKLADDSKLADAWCANIVQNCGGSEAWRPCCICRRGDGWRRSADMGRGAIDGQLRVRSSHVPGFSVAPLGAWPTDPKPSLYLRPTWSCSSADLGPCLRQCRFWGMVDGVVARLVLGLLC